MATYSRIPAWRVPWTEEPGELQAMQMEKSKHNLVTKQQTTRDNEEHSKGVKRPQCILCSTEDTSLSRVPSRGLGEDQR